MFTVLQTLKGFFARFWPLLLVASLVVTFMYWKRSHDASDAQVIADLQKRHAEEVQELQRLQEQRATEYEENIKTLQVRLADIESQYAAAQQRLTEEKQVEVKQILKESGDNPQELAQKLATAAGFVVVGAQQ